MFIINFANDWIRTSDLWFWKQPLYQLSHNHCQIFVFCYKTAQPIVTCHNAFATTL